MGHVNINGKSYNIPDGKSISVVDNRLYVDGVPYGESLPSPRVEIVWTGPLASLSVDNGSVECGAVEGDVRAKGSVNSGKVNGSVIAGGSVKCDDVAGDVKAGGSISCGNVGGQASAGGSVSRR